MALLEVSGLHVGLSGQEILRGIDLSLNEGEILALLGANGAGKTTLMRALSGIYRASAGEIRFDGKVITNAPAHVVVGLGICQAPEGRQVFSTMSVRENLLLGGGPHGLAALDEVTALFPVVGDRLTQAAGSLSGGEQQMLAIGRALMRRPRLLLLDEPSLGLAPKLVRQIFDLLARIRASGLPLLLVEQNARAALRIADRAAVLESGRIALEGPASTIAGEPRIVQVYLGGSV